MSRPVPLFCPFCTVTQYATPIDGEDLFATKGRLRQAMGQSCTKSAGKERCPMRNVALTIPTPEEFEVA